MTQSNRLGAILLIALVVVFGTAYTALQMTFDYPSILREPADIVLRRFAEGGGMLILYWYGMTIAALAFIPVAVAFAAWVWRERPVLAAFSATFGILGGLVQALGLVRWVVLVPSLAATYVDPSAGETERQMIATVFDVANRYLGMGVGEHFGYAFTALWTATIAIMIWQRWRWLSITGLVLALGIAAGMAETFGVEIAGTINGISFSVWALWALVLGVVMLLPARRLAIPAAAAVA